MSDQRPTASGPKGGFIAPAFFLLGFFFFLLFCTAAAVAPWLWVGGERGASAGAMLHAAVLGHLIPFGLAALSFGMGGLGGGPQREGFFGHLHFLIYLAGLLTVLPSFGRWDLASVAHAGLALVLAVAIYAAICLYEFEKGKRRPMVQVTLFSSILWLVMTLAMGVAAAANRYWEFLPMSSVTAIHAGMHSGFGGYFVLLLVGLSYGVFQSETRCSPERRLWTFLLLNGGILVSVFGIAFGLPTLLPGFLMALAGVLLFWGDTLLSRPEEGGAAGAWVACFHAGLVSVLAVMGVGLAMTAPGAEGAGNWEGLYLFLWLTGGTSLPLTGILGGMLAPGAGGSAGRGFAFWVYAAGVLVAAAGIFLAIPRAISSGGLLLLLGGLGLAWPVVRISVGRFFPGGASAGEGVGVQLTDHP